MFSKLFFLQILTDLLSDGPKVHGQGKTEKMNNLHSSFRRDKKIQNSQQKEQLILFTLLI
jgi:hypothetical protein